MGFFNRIRWGGDGPAPAPGEEVLVFGPAVLWMTITGRGTPAELDRLAAGVARFGVPAGFGRDRVLAAATEMSRQIRIDGTEGVLRKMSAVFPPALSSDALRLALAVALTAPGADDGLAGGPNSAPNSAPDRDLALLAEIGRALGLSRAAFDALVEAVRAKP